MKRNLDNWKQRREINNIYFDGIDHEESAEIFMTSSIIEDIAHTDTLPALPASLELPPFPASSSSDHQQAGAYAIRYSRVGLPAPLSTTDIEKEILFAATENTTLKRAEVNQPSHTAHRKSLQVRR